MNNRLVSKIGKACLAKNLTVAVVETAAGGGIALSITSVAGASAWFDSSVVAYSGKSKLALGTDYFVIQTSGAVSAETAVEMAFRYRNKMGVSLVLAETSFAPPQKSGARSRKTVGTSFIAIAGPDGTSVKEYLFTGNRRKVMSDIVRTALADLYLQVSQ